jgi:small nuclear ribonucleoprotein (snRNP)-like protein
MPPDSRVISLLPSPFRRRVPGLRKPEPDALIIVPLRRINEDVLVRLKWGQTEYKGRLISVDSYMNIQLSGTEEFIDGKSTGSLGQVLIRYSISSLNCHQPLFRPFRGLQVANISSRW